MKSFVHSFLGVIAAVVLLALVGLGVGACVTDRTPSVPKHAWLTVDLHDELPEYDPPGGVLGQLSGGGETLQRLLDNLDKARVDERIEGVILRLSAGASIGMAQSEEIRGAIRRLQAAGKPVYAWAESFELRQYYLMTACDEIWAPPTAFIEFHGVAAQSMHVKEALDKLGIRPNLHKIKDYKAAAELVTRTDSSEPARENDRWLLDDYWNAFAAVLRDDRGLSESDIEALMQHVLFTAEEAKEAKLIDTIFYWDEVENRLKGEDDDKLRTIDSAAYGRIPPAKLGFKGRKTIAVVHAQGMILGRESGVNPLLGVTMGHETIIAALRSAREDDDVVAVIFRVDSPGGDALSSDLMGHEVQVTAEVKPVVVSMVNVAASGGYAISYRATRMLADPGTVTGSIGSISGKFNMAGFYDKLGITFDAVTRGPNALFDSELHDYTPEQRARFEEDHWAGFNAWLADVAKHRDMSVEKARGLAEGRVFTGRQAVENGLVDELGGLDRAIDVARELAGLPADEKVTVRHLPEAKGLLETLLGGDEASIGNAARWLVHRELRRQVVETRRLVEHGALGAL